LRRVVAIISKPFQNFPVHFKITSSELRPLVGCG
jgi:hypothetical protein